MKMTSYYEDDSDSEDEYIIEALNDNYKRRYIVDINYNRPLKNYPLTLNKIDEVDETSVRSTDVNSGKDENGNPIEAIEEKKNLDRIAKVDKLIVQEKVKIKQRPKSASCAIDEKKAYDEKQQKRPRSSCASYPSRIPIKKEKVKAKSDSDSSSGLSVSFERDTTKKVKRSQSCYDRFFADDHQENAAFPDYPERSNSACCMRPPEHYDQRFIYAKRSNSQPNISRRKAQDSQQQKWSQINRFKRSLRLLGLSNSDFGLPESPKVSEQLPPRPRSSLAAPTFYTKILERSISLDSLREIIREASYDDSPGLPQRRILSQAAYEEWYFKKAAEHSTLSLEKRQKSEAEKELIEVETRERKEKAGEKFLEWLNAKKKQEKNKKVKKIKLDASLDRRLMKTKEEIDKAYLEWKKKKQTDLDRKKQSKIADAEREQREKADKEERRLLADKVFQEWKRKLEEKEKEIREKEKAGKEKFKESMTERSTKTNKSFKVWKDLKDDEIKSRFRNARNAAKRAEAARTMQVAERSYEAEQAFEEWLDKVDTRKQKGRSPKIAIPWAPT